jgi:hypothetical protein
MSQWQILVNGAEIIEDIQNASDDLLLTFSESLAEVSNSPIEP